MYWADGCCHNNHTFVSIYVAGLPVEYCESQMFKAQCYVNEVVSMTSALYGRMRIGSCVEADLGYLGCQQNVLDLTDRKCSGRRECEIRIPDGDLDTSKPCYKELKVYLEASYKCVRGKRDLHKITNKFPANPAIFLSL